jgi:hypothetical protein
MKVRAVEVELKTETNDVIAVGVDEDGEQVRFAVGLALGRGILEALQNGEQPEVEIDPWQIIREDSEP